MRRTVVTQRAIWDTYLGQSLRSCAVPSRAKVERGVERAWQDIRAAISTVEVDPEQWEAGYFSLFTDAQAFAGFMA